MKEFSICRDQLNAEPQKLQWEQFRAIMEEEGISEALIFYTDDHYSEVNRAKKYISRVMIEKDGEKAWAEYNIVEHRNEDRIMPCLVLLEVDIQYALRRALHLAYRNEFIIRCLITDDGKLLVRKYDILEQEFGFSAN